MCNTVELTMWGMMKLLSQVACKFCTEDQVAQEDKGLADGADGPVLMISEESYRVKWSITMTSIPYRLPGTAL